MATDPADRRQTTRFLLLYALAVAGGAIAYVPFLTILLPIQVTGMAGDRDVTWLAYATFAGALAASAANIFFGWLSDRSAVRRPWIIGGLLWSCALLVGFAYITDVVWLIAWLVLWQMGLNMMLSALGAWAGDTIPDRQKGLLGGLLAFAPAAGALSASLITLPDLADAQGRLWLVAMLVAACVLPAVLAGAPRPFPELMRDEPAPEEEPTRRPANMVVRMWLARLLIQISEAALFAFLYFWFRSVDPAMTDANVARIFSVILVASVPLALLTGHLADRPHGVVEFADQRDCGLCGVRNRGLDLPVAPYRTNAAHPSQGKKPRARPRHFQPDQHQPVAGDAVARHRPRSRLRVFRVVHRARRLRRDGGLTDRISLPPDLAACN